MLLQKPPRNFPDLCTYSSQSNDTQLAMLNYLISCVRQNGLFNIKTIEGASAYINSKIKSLNIFHSSLNLVVETPTGNTFNLPLELIVSIEPVSEKSN